MTLIDIDSLSFYYGGLSQIYPYDFEGTARYFMEQVKAKTPVKAIPCDYIKEKARKASGPESTYLRKLLNDWEKDNE